MLPSSFEEAVSGPAMSGRHILVAVSGGLDSTSLLHALVQVRDGARIRLTVAHVHHGLRGQAADADEAFVVAQANEFGLPVHLARVEPAALREGGPKRARPTLQEAARQLRWEALDALCDQVEADCIATAHHLDDQAETVLMRILRGTSPDGLGGMAPVSADGRRVRPLLDVSRAEIEAYAHAQGLAWREDASNASDVYTRNRLRRHTIPALSEDFNPQLLRAVARLAETQRRDSAWIGTLVDDVAPDWITADRGGLLLALDGWSELPTALADRLIVRAWTQLGGGRDLSRSHIERVRAFLEAPERHEGGRSLELPGGLRLVRETKRFRLAPASDGSADL